MNFLPNVSQFHYVWGDYTRAFGEQKFRIVGYGAYSAGGLIGPESNGIAILDEFKKCVVTDEIACASSLCYIDGPTKAQQAEFDRLLSCSEEDFMEACYSGRSRYAFST